MGCVNVRQRPRDVLSSGVINLVSSFSRLPTPPTLRAVMTLPNAVTAAGYGLALWHLGGGPGWAALASIAADEADGRIARATGQTSIVGSNLDWSTDVALAAAYARKLKVPDPAIVGMAVVQASLRAEDWRPPVLSARALLMLADVALDAHKRGVRAALLERQGRARKADEAAPDPAADRPAAPEPAPEAL